MKKDCENCIYGDVRDYRRVIKKDSVTIIQDGKKNVVCTHTRDKTIDFDGENMKCSAWKWKGVKK